MFCPKCGQDNSDSSARCIRCGEMMPTGGTAYGLGPATHSMHPSQREVVNNNLVWAILATLFCCVPTGIVAIVYAAQVDAKVSGGDIAGARESARNAATWSWVSFGLIVVGVGGYLMLLVLGESLRH